MKPTWIVNDFGDDDLDQITAALKRTGTDFLVSDYSKTREIESYVKDCKGSVLYGSVQFARAVNKVNRGIRIYGMLGTDCTDYYNSVPEELLLNYPYFFSTWDEVCRSYDLYCEMLGGKFFIKSNSGKKVLTGQVLEKCEIEFITKHGSVSKNTIVLLSASRAVPKKEYRAVVVDGKFITASSYSWEENPTKDYPKEIESLSERIAALYEPDSAFTCDFVAVGDGFKLVEINSFSFAGLYECNREMCVGAINDLFERERS